MNEVAKESVDTCAHQTKRKIQEGIKMAAKEKRVTSSFKLKARLEKQFIKS